MITFKELISQITIGSGLVENNITEDNWDNFEEQLHFEFPPDYVKFINFYGTGRLCQLVWVLNPFSAHDRFNLLFFLKNQTQIFDQLKKESDIKSPYKLFQNGSGIMPFAFTDNGDTIYWNIKNANKESYPIIIFDGRSMRSEEHHVGFNEFLNKILNKSINSSIIIKGDIVNKRFDPLDKQIFKI